MNRFNNIHPIPGSESRVERPQRLPAWIVLVGTISLALVAVFAAFIVVRQQTASTFTPLYTGGARAQLSQTEFDYGDVKNGSAVKTSFTIQNVGDRQLYFPQEPIVQVVEGCCPPQTEIDRSELMPGETANVSLSFSMHEGMDGVHEFRVKVRSNDTVEPEQEVVVLSNWVP
jgi:hypothetical protein